MKRNLRNTWRRIRLFIPKWELVMPMLLAYFTVQLTLNGESFRTREDRKVTAYACIVGLKNSLPHTTMEKYRSEVVQHAYTMLQGVVPKHPLYNSWAIQGDRLMARADEKIDHLGQQYKELGRCLGEIRLLFSVDEELSNALKSAEDKGEVAGYDKIKGKPTPLETMIWADNILDELQAFVYPHYDRTLGDLGTVLEKRLRETEKRWWAPLN